MEILYISLGVILGLGFLVLIISLICFLMTFYSPKRKKKNEEEYNLPNREMYQKYREVLIDGMKMARALPREEIYIKSYDGLILHGHYYEIKKGAPIDILFHGYRGEGERDLSIGIERCFKLNRNVILVDQRGAGKSEGRVISFGVKERYDVLSWINFVIEHFGNDTEIYVSGVSMGASTVLMSYSEDFPKNVRGLLADCPYSSQKEIICKVVRKMKLPASIFYPFIKLGARIFGGFKLEEITPLEAVKNIKIPTIFIHGDNDNFVPCEMSRELYNHCSAKKSLLIIEGAEHGTAYIQDKDLYVSTLREFQ